MSLTNKLIWLGDEPVPPAEPRFLSYFQWRLKRFRPFTLPVYKINKNVKPSDETVAAMRDVVTNLPAFPAMVMAQYGVALLPVNHLWNDIHYLLGWFGPPGRDRTEGYDYVGGICVNDGHLAVVAETVCVRNRGWQKQGNLVGIAWHELGHCFNRALARFLALDYEGFCDTPEFRAAWLADSSKLVGSYRNQFAYFLQADGRGESEAFAECFAVALGMGCIESNTKDFPLYFPRCLAVVKAVIENRIEDALSGNFDLGLDADSDKATDVITTPDASPEASSNGSPEASSNNASDVRLDNRALALAKLEALLSSSSLVPNQPSS